MSKTRKVLLKGKHRRIIATGAVVLLLVLALGAGVLWQRLQHPNSTNTDGQTGNNSAAGTPQESLPQSVQEARSTAVRGKVDDSNKQIASDIASSSSDDEKFELYIQMGVNYENQKKYDDALTAYKQAEALKKTAGLYSSMGRAAAAKGDKAAALDYYRKALPLLDRNDPLYEFRKGNIEAGIKQNGG